MSSKDISKGVASFGQDIVEQAAIRENIASFCLKRKIGNNLHFLEKILYSNLLLYLSKKREFPPANLSSATSGFLLDVTTPCDCFAFYLELELACNYLATLATATLRGKFDHGRNRTHNHRLRVRLAHHVVAVAILTTKGKELFKNFIKENWWCKLHFTYNITVLLEHFWCYPAFCSDSRSGGKRMTSIRELLAQPEVRYHGFDRSMAVWL